MATIRRMWVPALLAALVVGLIGPSVVSAVEPRATTKKVMIPAAAFIATTDQWDYSNNGVNLSMMSGSGNFTAPIPFNVPASRVSIKKIVLYAYDDDGGDTVCVYLYRAEPTLAMESFSGQVCTSDSNLTPQAIETSAIYPRLVNTGLHGAYLWVNLSGTSVIFYGAVVSYSYTP